MKPKPKNLQHLATATQAPKDLDAIAEQIIQQHQLAFPDEFLTKRAHAIFKSRLKDIRTSDQTIDVMARDPKIGGLGLDRDLAEQVVASLTEQAKQLKSRGMVAKPEPIPAPPPPKVPTVQAEHPAPKPPLTRVFPSTDQTPPKSPMPSVTEAPRPSRPIVRPPDIPAPPPAKPVPQQPPPTVKSSPSWPRSRGSDRPKVADITQPSRTLGPAEELKSMSVAEFRRLGQGATDSTKHLFETFEHLKHESFRLWAEAVAGWRQSSVYQLYLAMGRQSLDDNIPISEVIRRRAKDNQPYLSEHEFASLADLNRRVHA